MFLSNKIFFVTTLIARLKKKNKRYSTKLFYKKNYSSLIKLIWSGRVVMLKTSFLKYI